LASIAVPDDGGWTIAKAVIGHVPHLLLWGVPGTGKSTFACVEGAYAWYRIYCHEEMSDMDIVGGASLRNEGGATVSGHSDGVGLRAWREGKRLVIDEIDKAPRDVPNDILNEIEAMYFRIPELGNAVVQAEPRWRHRRSLDGRVHDPAHR